MSGAKVIKSSVQDISKYTPFNSSTNLLLNDTNWSTITSINGAGYLSKACFYSNTSNSQIRIKIDGVIIHQAYNSVASGTNGCLIMDKHINYTGSNYFVLLSRLNYGNNVVVYLTKLATYPYTSGGDYFVIIPKELYFKSSLTIEVKVDTYSSTVYTNIEGGTK